MRGFGGAGWNDAGSDRFLDNAEIIEEIISGLGLLYNCTGFPSALSLD
jgi:hypothetical protein